MLTGATSPLLPGLFMLLMLRNPDGRNPDGNTLRGELYFAYDMAGPA